MIDITAFFQCNHGFFTLALTDHELASDGKVYTCNLFLSNLWQWVGHNLASSNYINNNVCISAKGLHLYLLQ